MASARIRLITLCSLLGLVLVIPASGGGGQTDESRPAAASSAPALWLTSRKDSVPVSAPAPIALEDGLQLLIDDYLIGDSLKVTRKVNQPRRFLAAPVVTSGEGFRNTQFGMTVVYDPSSDAHPFRLWYTAGFLPGEATGSCLGEVGYLESKDGIHWLRPAACLTTLQGTHILDDRRNNPNPGEAFKMTYVEIPSDAPGMRVAFSPDGLNWTPYNQGKPTIPAIFNDDIWNPYYDPFHYRYVVLPKMVQPHTWTNAEGQLLTQEIRLVGYSTSPDFKQWTEPVVIFAPDSGDSGITQWYGGPSSVKKRGQLLVGMLKVLRDDWVADGAPPEASGMGYTVLAWSRDGEHWTRDRETYKFFEPDPRVGVWDHAIAWIDSEVDVGDQVYLYYGGYRWGHKYRPLEDRQIGLVTMPRDRYVAREAGDVRGVLRTRLVTFDADAIVLNADAQGGEIWMQTLDVNGNPIPGFAYADCQPITTDSLDAAVRCLRLPNELKDIPVYLEFSLIHARLFAFTLK